MRDADTQQWMERLDAIDPGRTPPKPQLRAHDHAALVYWDSADYLASIIPFLVDGLREGDLVVHVAHDEPIASIVSALESSDIDVEAMKRSGRLMLLTAAQAFAPQGRFDLEEATAGIKRMITDATAAGAPRVRFSVDLSYVLSGTPGIEDFMVLDARANEDIFPQYPFICVCAYNASKGVNHLVEDMFLTHPLVFVRGIPLANPYYEPWAELSARASYLRRWKERYSAVACDGA